MGEEDGVDRAAGGDGDAIGDGECRVAECLEEGDEGDVDFAGGEEIGEAGGMLEHDRAIVGDDERPGVKVLHAADAQPVKGGKWTHAQASSRVAAGWTRLWVPGTTRS